MPTSSIRPSDGDSIRSDLLSQASGIARLSQNGRQTLSSNAATSRSGVSLSSRFTASILTRLPVSIASQVIPMERVGGNHYPFLTDMTGAEPRVRFGKDHKGALFKEVWLHLVDSKRDVFAAPLESNMVRRSRSSYARSVRKYGTHISLDSPCLL